jgi:hypothetical protein
VTKPTVYRKAFAQLAPVFGTHNENVSRGILAETEPGLFTLPRP